MWNSKGRFHATWDWYAAGNIARVQKRRQRLCEKNVSGVNQVVKKEGVRITHGEQVSCRRAVNKSRWKGKEKKGQSGTRREAEGIKRSEKQ